MNRTFKDEAVGHTGSTPTDLPPGPGADEVDRVDPLQEIAKIREGAGMSARNHPTPPRRAGRRVRPRPDDKPDVVQLARLLARTAPLAKLINSDEFTDVDRARLRALVGELSFFTLSMDLDQMAGSRTRTGQERRRV